MLLRCAPAGKAVCPAVCTADLSQKKGESATHTGGTYGARSKTRFFLGGGWFDDGQQCLEIYIRARYVTESQNSQ